MEKPSLTASVTARVCSLVTVVPWVCVADAWPRAPAMPLSADLTLESPAAPATEASAVIVLLMDSTVSNRVDAGVVVAVPLLNVVEVTVPMELVFW